jgi:uncharacterized protein (DUF927 family)
VGSCAKSNAGRILAVARRRKITPRKNKKKSAARKLPAKKVNRKRVARKQVAREQAEPAPIIPETTPPQRPQPSRQLQARTAEDIGNEQTASLLAARIWAALVGQRVLKDMASLVDELLESHLLDDDDEEADEGWLDEHQKREKRLLEEAIADGLDKYPDFNAVNDLPPNPDADIAQDSEQLRQTLAKCPVGATKFKDAYQRTQLEKLVKSDLSKRFKKNPKYSERVRGDVPGTDVRKYGDRGRTSSVGTFAKAVDYEDGGGLAALFTGGWTRVAKDRIDPLAWSHQYGLPRKGARQSWRHHFTITERNGNRSPFELPRETLSGSGAAAIKALMKAGVHVIKRDNTRKALTAYLYYKPKREIIRMPHAGWAQVGPHWIFVRPDEVILPAGMPRADSTTYELDAGATRHGLHVVGTAAEWGADVAGPLRGNSNVALSLGTFFAAPLLRWASEPGGGNHLYGRSTIGKTLIADLGQSIYGWPHELSDDAFGVSWGGTAAGFDALALARTDLGLPLDEITLADAKTAEGVVYNVASGTKGPRATSRGYLREMAHASVLVLSTGEKSLAEFIGRNLQEGARKRLVDIPAEVQPGSAFETIPRAQIHSEGKRFIDAVKRCHGAVGCEWQRHLVAIGPEAIKAQLSEHRGAFLARPEVIAVVEKAHPQVQAVVNRFALHAAALRMAIVAGLLPWTAEEVDLGIVRCMARWVQLRGNTDTAGELARAAVLFQRDLVSSLQHRFIRIDKNKAGKWSPATEADEVKARTPEQFDGYIKPGLVLIRPEPFRRLCDGAESAGVARHLLQRGVLVPDDKGGFSKSEQIVSRSGRFYVLRIDALTL